MSTKTRSHTRARVYSDEGIVRNARVDVRSADTDDWVDVRTAVTNIEARLKVGAVSRIHLDLLMAEVDIEAVDLHVHTQVLQHTVRVLEAMDLSVRPHTYLTADRYCAKAKDIGMSFDVAWAYWTITHPTASEVAFRHVWAEAMEGDVLFKSNAVDE